MLDRLYKIPEVAQLLGLSRSFVYQLIRKGEMPAVRFRSSVRVRPEDLEKYVKASVINSVGDA